MTEYRYASAREPDHWSPWLRANRIHWRSGEVELDGLVFDSRWLVELRTARTWLPVQPLDVGPGEPRGFPDIG